MIAALSALNSGDGGVFLDAYLAPFQPWPGREDVTAIIVKRPGEIWIEAAGERHMRCVALPQVDDRVIQRLAEQIGQRRIAVIMSTRSVGVDGCFTLRSKNEGNSQCTNI